MNLIEIIAESPISAAIVAATVALAVVHEMALATHTPAARRIARILWGPFLVSLLMFLAVATARIAWIV